MSVQQKLEHLRRQAEDSMLLRRTMVERLGEQILEMASLMQGVLGSGGKILIAGSAEWMGAASHFAAQLIVRHNGSHKRQALPAVALSTDGAVVGSGADEFGFKDVFARQIEGLGHKGDLLVVLAATGEAEDLARAVQMARSRSLLTAALLGGTGGHLVAMVDLPLVVPHQSPARVYEEHLFLIHLLVELIESDLFA